ncbi:MAG: hypothetical protein K2H35_05580, partial [Muribaculaceae bacterium]|nr:hypothetical protein [Muribaculaceae bacterium]
PMDSRGAFHCPEGANRKALFSPPPPHLGNQKYKSPKGALLTPSGDLNFLTFFNNGGGYFDFYYLNLHTV